MARGPGITHPSACLPSPQVRLNVDGAFFDVTVPADLPASREVHVAMPTEQPAEEAALSATPPTAPRPPQALARAAEAPLATEAEGLRLHLSSNSITGYKGVFNQASGRFIATRKHKYLGAFDTAVEAAVAYARAVGQAEAAGTAAAVPAEEPTPHARWSSHR